MPPNISRNGKKQISRPTHRQLGFLLGQNVLNRITQTATMLRDLVEKGRGQDERGMPIKIECKPSDIKSSWSPDQLGAYEEFISIWATEPEPPPIPPRPPPTAPKVARAARKTKANADT